MGSAHQCDKSVSGVSSVGYVSQASTGDAGRPKTHVRGASPGGFTSRSPTYTTAALHPFAPLSHDLHLYVFFLPCSKERYKNNNTGKPPTPLSLSLSRCGVRRWVLASLSVPALVSTSVAPALTQQTRTRRRNRKTKVLAGRNDPELLRHSPPLLPHVRRPPSLRHLSHFLYKMYLSTDFNNSPVHPRVAEP